VGKGLSKKKEVLSHITMWHREKQFMEEKFGCGCERGFRLRKGKFWGLENVGGEARFSNHWRKVHPTFFDEGGKGL